MRAERITIMRKLRDLGVLFLLLTMLSAGCDGKKERTLGTGVAPTKGQISKEDLRAQLNDFTDYFKSAINAAADEIEQKSSKKKDQMISLQNRSKTLQGLYAMSQQQDAIVAFIDTWALCTRLRIYFEDGDGSKLYGENQAIAIDTARHIESSAEDIGRLFLSENAFQTTQRNIIEFARANPIKANFSNIVMYATAVKEGGTHPFESIVRIPMAPFRGMEGVEHTAVAINNFTDTTGHFADVVADLPESSRWQMLLFLYELEETEMAKSFVSSTVKLSDSSSRLADSSEKWPERMREQMSLLLDEIDRKQTNLQATLAQLDKTAQSVMMALELVKEGANSVDSAANSIKETADAWQEAAVATGNAASEIGNLVPSKEAASSTFSLKDIKETAGEIRATADDLRRLLDELTWRAVEIIAAILAAALIYRMAVLQMVKAWGKKKFDS